MPSRINYSLWGAKKRLRDIKAIQPKLLRCLFTTFVLFFVFAVIGALAVGAQFARGLYAGIIATTPEVNISDLKPTGYSSFVYDVSGNQIAKLVTSNANRIYQTIDKIPEPVQKCFIAIEDKRFLEHNGIDPKGILRAFVVGMKSHDFNQGASTITQQLIKNTIFTNWTEESSFSDKLKRKVQEQQLALELEKQPSMNKDIILELYLNTINLGQNTLGIQAASLRYFNKDSSSLNLSEGAVLAAIPQNPTKYNPISHPEKNAERRMKVLSDALEAGFITQKDYNEAIHDNVYDRISVVNQEKTREVYQTYFTDALVEQVLQDLQDICGMSQQQAYYQLYSGGLAVYSTQDTKIQKYCDDFVNNPKNFSSDTKYKLSYALTVKDVSGNYINLNETTMKNALGIHSSLYTKYDSISENIAEYKTLLTEEGYSYVDEHIEIVPQPQLSLVIMDQSTGHVKAIIGGRGDKQGSMTLNRATNTMRQPGSTFKVLSTYLPAFDTGKKSLNSTQEDAPFNYDNGRPVKNWYSGYKGTCTLRYGIEQSLNIVTVKTLTDIGPQTGFDYLKHLKFTTLVENEEKNGKIYTDVTQALALGGITHGVKNIELTGAYASIANMGVYCRPVFYTKVIDHDGNILLDNTEPTRLFKSSTAYMLISAMEDVINKGTGKAVKFVNQDLAGKTGTTSDNKDVWFAGFSPYYTCCTWAGYDDNTVLGTSQERALAKTAWKYVMEHVHEDLPARTFQVPSDCVTVDICSVSGKRGTSKCLSAGTVYTEFFDHNHIPDGVCTSSHYTAPAYTPRSTSPSTTTPSLTPEQQAALAVLAQQQALEALLQQAAAQAAQQAQAAQ